MNIARRLLLVVSGILLLLIGTMILIFPHSFYASNGVTLGNEASLLSEIRAPGGLLIGCAIILLLGVVRQNMLRSALILSALVYGTFGVARLFSFVIDGLPVTSLIAATFLEIIIGALSVLLIPGTKSESSATETVAGLGATFEKEKLWN